MNNESIQAETIIGTPFYLAPEICQSRPYNKKADIWSIGCILYELCALKHPFDAKSINALIIKITRGEYEDINDMYSNDLRQLIASMLRINPEERPSIDQIFKKKFLKPFVEGVYKEVEEENLKARKAKRLKNTRKSGQKGKGESGVEGAGAEDFETFGRKKGVSRNQESFIAVSDAKDSQINLKSKGRGDFF